MGHKDDLELLYHRYFLKPLRKSIPLKTNNNPKLVISLWFVLCCSFHNQTKKVTFGRAVENNIYIFH